MRAPFSKDLAIRSPLPLKAMHLRNVAGISVPSLALPLLTAMLKRVILISVGSKSLLDVSTKPSHSFTYNLFAFS